MHISKRNKNLGQKKADEFLYIPCKKCNFIFNFNIFKHEADVSAYVISKDVGYTEHVQAMNAELYNNLDSQMLCGFGENANLLKISDMKLIINRLIDFINYLHKKYSFHIIDDFYFRPVDKSRYDSTLYIVRRILKDPRCIYNEWNLEHSYTATDHEFHGTIGIVT